MKTVYPSKILLAGEYTVLLKSDALAIPFDYFFGGWRAGVRSDYPFDLNDWIEHLSLIEDNNIQLDLDRMHADFNSHIRFVSNVPQGGGLGSSGGVTAAFFDRYVHTDLSVDKQFEAIREILSKMESFFHGESSGVDPLVSLTGKSFNIQTGKSSLLNSHIPQSTSLHLILTPTIRRTAPLITYFMDSLKKKKYNERINNELIPSVQDFVSSWCAGRVSDLELAFQRISQIEWDLFKPMITKDIKDIWKAGLDSNNFSVKLCGAGGGGAYLACGDLPDDLGLRTLRIS